MPEVVMRSEPSPVAYAAAGPEVTYECLFWLQRNPEVSASEVVPWPVIWSLARYHRSHVWYTGTRPRMEALVHDFQQFAAKVRWKWHFREEPKGFYIHLKNSRYIPPYPLVTPPELEGWLSLLREKMLMTARTTLHNPRLQQSRSNVLPLTKHGWKCLKTSCWVAFLNDKDGGFTLVHEDHVPQAHMEVLNSRWYREVFPEMYWSDLVTKQYKNLCADVERVMGEGDGVARNLFRSFVRRGAASIAKLDLTVKSHKGAGFVTFRNIHSLSCYSLEGLSQWAARELRSWLHTRCHLLKDTRQFVTLMSTKCAKPDETLYRLDAKEFFMSGRHPELIEAGIANLQEGRRRDCLRKVLEFLLDNQYVKSGALPERLWKVEEDSGMGLVHSGDLCDAALDSLAESWSTDPVVLREHGVRLYVRLRDDIFFIGSDRRLSVSYVQELRRKAKFFHIIAECPSDREVQFLEVKVWKSGARYHTVPCPKPTSLGIPLDVTSTSASGPFELACGHYQSRARSLHPS